jgi:hypothetical protein
LWLRARWSRAEIFAQVERSFWRHNAYVLLALLVLLAVIGVTSRLPLRLLGVGLPLLALGTTLSTYLGLLITRGLRWFEIALGLGVMLALMVIAVAAVSGTVSLLWLVAFELLLAALAAVLRLMARNRWAQIDWAESRPVSRSRRGLA